MRVDYYYSYYNLYVNSLYVRHCINSSPEFQLVDILRRSVMLSRREIF
jgi:hypothetical protein